MLVDLRGVFRGLGLQLLVRHMAGEVCAQSAGSIPAGLGTR